MAHALSQDSNNPDGWTTCVHCSYYAVFQFMKYLLAEKSENPISYERQNANTGSDSHSYILDEIKNRIKNFSEARNLGERVRDLKQQRLWADYHNKVFTQAESLECEDKANVIIRSLKKLVS